jgi:hypothetical protein
MKLLAEGAGDVRRPAKVRSTGTRGLWENAGWAGRFLDDGL